MYKKQSKTQAQYESLKAAINEAWGTPRLIDMICEGATPAVRQQLYNHIALRHYAEKVRQIQAEVNGGGNASAFALAGEDVRLQYEVEVAMFNYEFKNWLYNQKTYWGEVLGLEGVTLEVQFDREIHLKAGSNTGYIYGPIAGGGGKTIGEPYFGIGNNSTGVDGLADFMHLAKAFELIMTRINDWVKSNESGVRNAVEKLRA